MDTLFEYSNLPNANILTHTAEVALSDEQRHSIKMLKKMHRDQDERENQDQETNENPSGFSSDINQEEGDFDVPESCTKVAADFFSPENIHECLRLTEEFRLLPKNHRAREDKLEVKKMILHAVNNAVSDFEKLTALENNLLWNVEHQQ